MPHVVAWLDHRNRTAETDDGCAAGCGRCSRCVRAAAVTDNVDAYGQADFPGWQHAATDEDGWC